MKLTKKLVAIVLAVLMVVSAMPFTVLAEDGAVVTFKTNATATDVEIDSDVKFTYYIEVDHSPYDGVVYGDDDGVYNVVDGKVTLPYNITAQIRGLQNKQTYSIKRLEYDNAKYALIEETEASFGEIASENYYLTKNGKKETITDDEYYAGIAGHEPDENGTVSYTTYKNSDGVEVAEKDLEVLNALDIKRTVSTTSTTYDLEEGTHYYIPGTLDEYTITYNISKSYNESKVFGKVVGYTFKANVSVDTDYEFDEGTEIDFADKEISEYSPTKKSARSACVSSVKNSMVRLTYRILEENVAVQSGRGIAVKEDPRLLLPADDAWSDASETLTYSTTVYAYEELIRTDYVYEMEVVDANRTVTFDASFAVPPTATFDIPFMVYDGTIPNACSSAEFVLKDGNGKVLEPNVDYGYEVKDASITIPVINTEYGYTDYIFSNLPMGSYSVQQSKGQDGYIVDTRVYDFIVNRRGKIEGDCFTTSSNLSSSSCALTNSTWSMITKFNVFKNNSFTIDFKAIDQNNEPVGDGDFLLIQRSAFLELVKTIADAGIDVVGGIDIKNFLNQIQMGDWSNVNIQMILDIILSVVNLDEVTLGNVVIPALLLETAVDWDGDETDGQVSFSNSSNILNILGALTNGGTLQPDQIASIIEQYFGKYLDENMAKALVTLAGMTTGIKVNTGMPSGKYVMMQTGSAKGYDKTDILYTFDIKSDGTATASWGVTFPLLVDAVNSYTDLDIELEDFLVNEDAFNNAADEIKERFGSFVEYEEQFVSGVADIIKKAFGEDLVDDEAVQAIKDDIKSNYEKTGNLIDAVKETVNEVNDRISQDVNTDWTVYNERYYTSIRAKVESCILEEIEGVECTVTDENGNKIEIDEFGYVTVPYGIYKLNCTGLGDDYIPDGELVTELEFDNYNNTYEFVAKYHHAVDANNAVAPTAAKDGKESDIICSECGAVLTEGTVLPAYGVDITISDEYANYGDVDEYDFGTTTGIAYGSKVTLTAVPVDGAEFVGWEIDGKLVSTNPVYTYTAYTNLKITPVFAEHEADTITVVFYDKYNNVVVKYVNVTVEEFQSAMAKSLPTPPIYPGYEFECWSMTEDEIKNLSQSATIKASYKWVETGFTVTTSEGVEMTVANGAENGSIPFDTLVTLHADGATAWKVGDTIVGYGDTYTFYVGADIDIEPVYESAVSAVPTVAMINNYQVKASDSNPTHKVMFLASMNVPNGYTLVDHGFVYGKNLAQDELTLDNVGNEGAVYANAGVIKSSSLAASAVEQFAISYGITAMNASACARAYLTFVDADNELETVYSDSAMFDYNGKGIPSAPSEDD